MAEIANILPEAVPLPKAPAIFGLSRSHLYRLAAAGQIRFMKVGSRTLVDAESVRNFLNRLPEATIRPDPRRPAKVSSSKGNSHAVGDIK
jgi:excisionase family DNA binding protein